MNELQGYNPLAGLDEVTLGQVAAAMAEMEGLSGTDLEGAYLSAVKRYGARTAGRAFVAQAQRLTPQSAGRLNKTLERGQQFLLSQAAKLDKDTYAALTAGRGKMVNTSYFCRRVISDGTLLDSADVLKTGTTNLTSGKTAKFQPFVCEYIQLAYATSPTGALTDPANVRYATTEACYNSETGAVNQLIPLAIMNGEITIMQNNVPFYRGPARDFFIGGNGNSQNYVNGQYLSAKRLETMIYINEEVALSARIAFPTGVTLDTTGGRIHYTEIAFIGQGFDKVA